MRERAHCEVGLNGANDAEEVLRVVHGLPVAAVHPDAAAGGVRRPGAAVGGLGEEGGADAGGAAADVAGGLRNDQGEAKLGVEGEGAGGVSCKLRGMASNV